MTNNLMSGWQEDLIEFLIAGGTVGRMHSDLLRRFQNKATTDMITNELESYKLEKTVQKFVITPKGGIGRPITFWRATTKLMEQFDEQQRAQSQFDAATEEAQTKIERPKKTKKPNGVSVEKRRRKKTT